ncbi:efflux RND transporter periplasmic adaptor subunit [Fretibacterium fastidiosum]|nr:efflux RND transporter periplasmic adaptor subunit [Fretibacterium fastidiosum]
MGVLNKVRVLLWVGALAMVGTLVTVQVMAKMEQAEANLRSLERETETVYPVTTEVLKTSDWNTWRSYYGQGKSAHTQNVTAYEREIVRAVHVQVGDRVKPGQTVVTLMVADRGARVQAQLTGYDEAKLNYNRLKELHAKGGISQSEVDSAYATLKSAEAQLKSSQSTLQRTELKASIEGIVAARNVEAGEVAEAGMTLIAIVDPREMEAELMVSKKDIFKINRNTSVDVYVDGVRSAGWVKRTSPEAQTGSGLYPVVVGLPEKSGILPGSYLEGRFFGGPSAGRHRHPLQRRDLPQRRPGRVPGVGRRGPQRPHHHGRRARGPRGGHLGAQGGRRTDRQRQPRALRGRRHHAGRARRGSEDVGGTRLTP